MKNSLLTLFLICSICCISQKKKSVLKSIFIIQKIHKLKGTQLILKKVVNDSRCPEGVQCIWAGECEIIISVYKNNKFMKDENILLSPKLYQENIKWFSKYYPNKKIKEINVMPYPKSEVVENSKTYLVKILVE